MNFLTFCSDYGYNQRCDMARESYQCFILCFNVIHTKEVNNKLLSFLGIKAYA